MSPMLTSFLQAYFVRFIILGVDSPLLVYLQCLLKESFYSFIYSLQNEDSEVLEVSSH